MMKTPLVSAVITTLNRPQFLPKAIDSVLHQTHENMEVIVVDNGSTDQTLSILRSYRDKIRALTPFEAPHPSPARARNAGAAESSGEFIAFLDDDDVWKPEKTEVQLRWAATAGAAVVSSDAEVIDEEGKLVRRSYLRTGPSSGDVFRSLLDENTIVLSSALVRKEEFMSLGGFDESSALAGVEDYHLWLRIAARSHFHGISDPLIEYRVHQRNMSAAGPRDALRSRRLVLRQSLQDPAVRRRRLVVTAALAKDYAREAMVIVGLAR